jgi:hypothetical protein
MVQWWLLVQRHYRLVEPWWVCLCWSYEDREMTPLHVFGQLAHTRPVNFHLPYLIKKHLTFHCAHHPLH